jgi:hypothetical protein
MTAADALRRLLTDVRAVRDRLEHGAGEATAEHCDYLESLALDGLAGEASGTCQNSFLGGVHGPAKPIVVNGICETCAAKQDDSEPTEEGQP